MPRRTHQTRLLARLRHHRLRIRAAYELTHPAPQYCLGYILAFTEAGAGEVDKFYMDLLVKQARQLARRPIRAVRLERQLWWAVWAAGALGLGLLLTSL